jgi:hypothetical protein
MKRVLCLVAVLTLACPAWTAAQDSKSAVLAKELAAALDAAKLDAIAAQDPADPETYSGALYFPGFELLVMSGKYASPPLIDGRLARKEYKDIYLELNGTVTSKVFIEDMGLDGLHAKRVENHPFDSVELGDTRTAFDGDWKKQKMSEDDYMKAFSVADARYAQILTALLAELKK